MPNRYGSGQDQEEEIGLRLFGHCCYHHLLSYHYHSRFSSSFTVIAFIAFIFNLHLPRSTFEFWREKRVKRDRRVIDQRTKWELVLKKRRDGLVSRTILIPTCNKDLAAVLFQNYPCNVAKKKACGGCNLAVTLVTVFRHKASRFS